MNESEWTRTIIQTAEQLKWWAVHFRPAMTSRGWRTPVQGKYAAGWPDLLLVRERMLAVELKSDVGKLTDEQEAWLHRLKTAGCEVHTWRPSDDWAEIVDTLRRRRPA